MDGRPGTFQIVDEKQEEWAVKLTEFEDIEFTINRYPIKLDDIAEARLTPAEMNAILCLLEDERPW